MNTSKLLHLTLTTTAGLLAVAGFGATASAQTSPNTVILVHGAWADASSWSKVIPRLVAAHLNVVAVSLPLTSLADDVAATERAIALVNGPILLVGHSYGGAVITEAGNNPKVTGLVFVAAYAPDNGESSLSLATANPTPVGAQIRPDASGFLKLTAAGIEEDFGQDLSDVEKVNLIATQGPTAGGALGALASTPAWKNKPTWFVIAANDRTVSPQLEKTEATRMNATTITLPTSHLAMLAAPERVADFIEAAAAKAGAK
ncbi:MAG: putative signal peptide protein [Candidatus Sulfotelmatobacter sp.]|nr:putative signal peptide protein [Candidatus Sulfotelmatobacter sp.]